MRSPPSLLLALLVAFGCGADPPSEPASATASPPASPPAIEPVPAVTPAPAPAPAPSIELYLSLRSYRGGLPETELIRDFHLKDGTLAFAVSGAQASSTDEHPLNPAGVPPVFLGNLVTAVTLTPAELRALAELLPAQGLMRAEKPVGRHMPRPDKLAVVASLVARVGDAAAELTVDDGGLAPDGTPRPGPLAEDEATASQIQRDLAAMHALGERLAGHLRLGEGDLLFEYRELENTTPDSFTEWQSYALRGGELRRRYQFSGADGHRRGPAFPDGAIAVDAATVPVLGKLLVDAGLVGTTLELEGRPMDGVQYRLVAGPGGSQTRVAVDVAQGSTPGPEVQAQIDGMKRLQRALDAVFDAPPTR